VISAKGLQNFKEKKVCYNYSILEHKYYFFIISFESCKRIVPHQITLNGFIFHEYGDDAPGDKMVIFLCEMTYATMTQWELLTHQFNI
jgi:hypothetical protein